jgi:HD-like signal output (HDOD) protein
MNDVQLATLKRLEGRIRELPILPAVIISLLVLDPADPGYFDHVVAYVNGDPGFAARLLQYANSAAMAPPKPITTINSALIRVGARGAVELIVAHSAARIFLPRKEWERGLWVHATLVGWMMRSLSPLLAGERANPDAAYLFGLLHDIGRFVLYLEAPDDLRAVDETDWDSPEALVQAETEICGFTHAELGYLALRKWSLPDSLALAVRYHHTTPFPPPGFPAEYVGISGLLHDADWLAVSIARAGLREVAAQPDLISAMLEKRKFAVELHATPETVQKTVLVALQEAMRNLYLLNITS